jgi:hypothetical protein
MRVFSFDYFLCRFSPANVNTHLIGHDLKFLRYSLLASQGLSYTFTPSLSRDFYPKKANTLCRFRALCPTFARQSAFLLPFALKTFDLLGLGFAGALNKM